MVWGIVNYFKCSSIIFFLPYPSARSQFLFFLSPFARPFLALLASLCPSIFDAVFPPLPVHLWRCLPPFVRPFMAMLASLCPSIYGAACLSLPFYLWRCLPPFPVHLWRSLPPFPVQLWHCFWKNVYESPSLRQKITISVKHPRYSVNRNCSIFAYKTITCQ